jgi:hypothetical protein
MLQWTTSVKCVSGKFVALLFDSPLFATCRAFAERKWNGGVATRGAKIRSLNTGEECRWDYMAYRAVVPGSRSARIVMCLTKPCPRQC